jgi:hypothetical protein
MANLIGSKDSFGIEYEIHPEESPGSPYIMGNTKLWLQGKYIGSFDDVHMLPITVGSLEGLDSEMANGCQFVGEEASRIYDLIESLPDSERYHYCLPLGEGFDDFLVYCYACNDRLYFVWKLYDKPFFEHPDYPEGVQSADVSADEFRRVVAEYARIIDIVGEERPGVKARKNCRKTSGCLIIKSASLGHSIDWNMSKAVIEDRYEITLDATFETDIPAAVIVLDTDPYSTTLPGMAPDKVYHGLTINPTSQTETDFRFEFLAEMPKQRVIIPYRIVALENAADNATESECHNTITVNCAYKCQASLNHLPESPDEINQLTLCSLNFHLSRA